MHAVVIADDQPVVWEGLAAIVGARGDCSVTPPPADGDRLLKLVRRLKPSLAIVDASSASFGGLELIRTMQRVHPGCAILLFCGEGFRELIAAAIRMGVSGCLTRSAPAAEIASAVEAVLAGGRYFSHSLSDILAGEIVRPRRPARTDAFNRLTHRERQVLTLIARGQRRAEIAARMRISVETVKKHRWNLMRKLKFHRQSDLFRFVLRHSLL